MSADVDKKLVKLKEYVSLELRLHNELQQIQGMLEPILATSLGAPGPLSDVGVPDLQVIAAG